MYMLVMIISEFNVLVKERFEIVNSITSMIIEAREGIEGIEGIDESEDLEIIEQ